MKKFLLNEDGATAIEYGLIIALVVIVSITGMLLLGGGSNGMWQTKVAQPVSNVM